MFTILPFKENLDIDYLSLEKYLNYLYSNGASRFYAMAYNSRYSQMRHTEIKSFNKFCIETVKKLDNKNIIVVGDPIHCSTEESLEFTLHAKENGADLISLIVREKYFSDEQILEAYFIYWKKVGFLFLSTKCPSYPVIMVNKCTGPEVVERTFKKPVYCCFKR